MADADVLIVGGGPVGLTLALLLAEARLDVVLVEAESGPTQDLRASTFHPPTLDMLEPFGVTADLLAEGLPCPHWQVRLHPSGERAVFDLGVLGDETGHPYRLQCEQWKLSRALERRVAGRIEMLLGARVTGLEQDEESVTVTLERDGAVVTRRGRFVAGCDGARSAVRRAVGLPFEGQTYPETTILATTTFPFEEALPGLSNVSYCWRETGGNFSLLRVPGAGAFRSIRGRTCRSRSR